MRSEQGTQHRERLFERLIQPYRAALIVRAHRLTGNGADAEDLVQETLLRAYTRLDQITSQDTVRGWLYTMLLRLFINRLRHRERLLHTVVLEGERSAAVALMAGRLPAALARTPEALMEQRLAYQAAQRAILKLSLGFRQVVILADIEGLTYEEIAAQLGLPMGTVRSRLARGRQILRRSLIAWGPEPPACQGSAGDTIS